MYTIRNRAMIIGNVGIQEPIKHIGDKSSVIRLSVATNDSYKDKAGNKIDEVTWHNVVLWDSLARYIEKYSNKGTLLAVSGKIVNRSYDDANGNKRYITEIRADEVTILANGKKVTE